MPRILANGRGEVSTIEAIQHQIRIHPVIVEFLVTFPIAVLMIAVAFLYLWWTGLLDHLAQSRW